MSDSTNPHWTPPGGPDGSPSSGDRSGQPVYGQYLPADGYVGGQPFQPYQLPQPVDRPRSLVLAVQLMWGGAVLTVLGAVVGLLMLDTMREVMAQELVAQGMPELATPGFLDAMDAVLVGSLVVGAVVGVGLWCWMAVKNGQGRSWARILSTVLAGVYALNFLFSLGQAGVAFQQVVGLVQLALVVTTVVLMWQPASSQFYAARSVRSP